ncbi:tetratricopeptide repeat protein [Aquirufa rosea]|uniref:Tetratricopeptide repeat protein n=1 Tax=Aquirufa rosea TaxID=2509241 RepID=A0A4Q1C0M2_9BACT|nr:tetratricopeptide repeat protein [Aquirufa rosea]
MKFVFGYLLCSFTILLTISCENEKSLDVGILTDSQKIKDSLQVIQKLQIAKKNILINYKLGISEAIEASKLAEKLDIPKLRFDGYLEVTRGALYAGIYDIAEVYLNKYLDLAEKEQDEKRIGQAMGNLGVLHMFLGELDHADSLFNQGITKLQQYAKQHQEDVSLEDQLNIYLDLGHIYKEKKQFSKAEQAYLSGITFAKHKSEFQLVYAQLLQSLGILYVETNQIAKAKSYLDLALEIQKKLENSPMVAACYLSLGEFSEKNNQKNAALDYYTKGLEIAKKSDLVEVEAEISDHLYQIYQKEGNAKLALDYLNQNLDSKAKMKRDEAKEALYRKSFARKIFKKLEAEKNQERKTRRLLAVLLLVIILVILYFLMKYFRRSKEIELGYEKELQQLEISKLENDRLQADLEMVNKKMASNALQAIQKEESLNLIVHRIRSTKPTNSDPSHLLKSISKDIEKLNSTKNWEEFEVRFVEIHKFFFQKLLEAHPGLSNNDRRLCAFLKLDMSTKEISNLTGQSLRAVEMARIRLRKKLNLTNSDVSIFTYLSDF